MSSHSAPLVLGVDGGQSGLRVRVGDDPAVRECPAVTQIDGDLSAAYADALATLAREASTPAARVVAGLSALPFGEGELRVLAAVMSDVLVADEVWLCSDAVTAHHAAFAGRPGVILVAGTGVACLALGAHGSPRIIDGAGYLIDDDGGAFQLGSRGLRAAVRSWDGRGPATTLGARALEAFDCEPDDLPEAVHRRARAVTDVAAFARVVLDECDRDGVARDLVLAAAEGLARTTIGALSHAGQVDVAVSGRLLDHDSPLRAAYTSALERHGVPASRVRSAPPPVEGAVALARADNPGRYAALTLVHHRGDAVSTAGVTSRRYLSVTAGVLAEASRDEQEPILAAGVAIADSIQAGGMIHTFGTGHSHLLAEELFYRAGGLARVNPILIPELMLHVSASRSTDFERSEGLAAEILQKHAVTVGDVVLIVSNSGGNRVTTDMARLAKSRGGVVIALTSLRHATSSRARQGGGPRLHELADIVLDNHGVVGDAIVRLPGMDSSVAPTSTVVGAALLQAVVAEAVAVLLERGVDAEIFRSSNTDGGDEVNAVLVQRYSTKVEAL